MTEQTYYVYLLSRPDGRPFYVGKGSGNRMHHHEREARTACDCHKCRIIRKIWRSGGEVGKRVLFRSAREDEALRMEAHWIATIGLRRLANVAQGATGLLERRPMLQPRNAAWVKYVLSYEGVEGRELQARLDQYFASRLEHLERRRRYHWQLRISPAELQAIDEEIESLHIRLNPGCVEQADLWQDSNCEIFHVSGQTR